MQYYDSIERSTDLEAVQFCESFCTELKGCEAGRPWCIDRRRLPKIKGLELSEARHCTVPRVSNLVVPRQREADGILEHDRCSILRVHHVQVERESNLQAPRRSSHVSLFRF